MKEKLQCVGAAAIGMLAVAITVIGGYGVVRLVSRIAYLSDPVVRLEATNESIRPLLRPFGS